MVHSLAKSLKKDRKAEDARQKATSANMASNWKRRRMEQLPEEKYPLWETQWEATQADRKRRKAIKKKSKEARTGESGYLFPPPAQVGKYHSRNCKTKTKKKAKRHALQMSGLDCK